jgi:iron complex transport system ATP-binding protein
LTTTPNATGRIDPTVPEWALSAERVFVRYGGSEVLREIDLSIVPGECVTLIGPNGAGKTTLLLALLGLIPVADGQVLVNGVPITRLGARQRGRLAAYVPQTIDHLPEFTVYDVVAGGRFPHIAPMRPLSAADDACIADALGRCGLTSIADRPVDRISGGERQKTLIAAALAQDAQAIFLDEPTTALDPAYQIELVRLLREWHARGRALIVVSHDLQLPSVLGGRIVAIRDGRIVADAGADQLLNAERLGSIYDAPMAVLTAPSGRRVVVPQWDAIG